MRWKYTEDSSPAEARQRAAVQAAIDALWRDFERDQRQLRQWQKAGSVGQAVGWWSSRIAAIHPELCWEAGGEPDGEMQVVITPEGELRLAPLAGRIVAQAGQRPGWRFLDARPACPPESVAQILRLRGGVSIDGWTFGVEDREDGFVSLLCRPRGLAGKTRAIGATIMAAEALLGEKRFARWIGDIEARTAGLLGGLRRLVGGSAADRATQLPLAGWGPAIDRAIEAVRSRRPAQPFHQRLDPEATGYSLYKCEAAEAEDYPRRSDVLVGSTPDAAITRALEGNFFSERHSGCGETFCFLKTEIPRDGHEIERRNRMEDALEAALRPPGLGCVFAGSLGVRYAYLELVVTDLARAIPVIREALRRGEVDRRSWLLMSDADQADEWIGIWPETPPPPGDSTAG